MKVLSKGEREILEAEEEFAAKYRVDEEALRRAAWKEFGERGFADLRSLEEYLEDQLSDVQSKIRELGAPPGPTTKGMVIPEGSLSQEDVDRMAQEHWLRMRLQPEYQEWARKYYPTASEARRIRARLGALREFIYREALYGRAGEYTDDVKSLAAGESERVAERQLRATVDFVGHKIAERCRPYIEDAENLSHAYAIGHAAMQDTYDHAIVTQARRDPDLARYVQGNWERANYLDKSLPPNKRFQELKRRVIAYVDEGVLPPASQAPNLSERD